MANDPTSGGTPLMAFVVQYLRDHPEAPYGELKSAAADAGYKVAPVVYGNARKRLGISSPAPRAPAGVKRGPGRPKGSGKKAAAAAATAPIAARRPRKSGRLDLDNLSGLVDELRVVIAERDRAMAAIDALRRVLNAFD